jgi:hypothetical protein
MWVFLSDAMLSIVAHRECKDTLLVRARLRGDIKAVFPEAQVWEDNTADYRWRAHVAREDVSKALSERALKIDYQNFKGSIQKADHDRHAWYLRVWAEGDRVQTYARDMEPASWRTRAPTPPRRRR